MRLCNVASARFASVLAFALCAGSNTSLAQASSPQPATSSTTGPTPAAKAPATNAPPPQSAAPSAPPAVFKSTAALVLVDVLVSNGQDPIHGIPRQQFRLLEDGKEQPLVALEEHKTIDPDSVHQPRQLPPDTYGNFPEASAASAADVLLLDALNTPMADQAYVRQQMIAYLRNITPGTHIAIFTLASRLRLLQGFTSDSRPLLAALNSKGALPGQSVLLTGPNDTSQSNMTDDLSQLGASGEVMAGINQFLADLTSFQTDLRVQYTLDALQELARYLSAVPGRKNLIWLSGSFPLSIDPDATLQSPFEAMRNYADQVRDTSRMLAASRVAVYPVDARGLLMDPAFSAQNSSSMGASGSGGTPGRGAASGKRRGSRGGGASAGASSSQPNSLQKSMQFNQQTAAEHATMVQIAEETGGHAYYETNGIKDAVAQAIQNGANYYTLAYVPENKSDDGRFHKLQVTIPEAASYKLTYRHGYVLPTAKQRSANSASASIAAAILRGAPSSSEILFEVRVLPSEDPPSKGLPTQPGTAGQISPKVKGPLQRYRLDFATDLHSASLSESADGLYHASIEVAAVAYDRDGARLNFVDKAFNVSLPEDQFARVMEKGLQVHQEIDLPIGEIYLRAAVHDLASDRVGSLEIPLMVKPAAAKAAPAGPTP